MVDWTNPIRDRRTKAPARVLATDLASGNGDYTKMVIAQLYKNHDFEVVHVASPEAAAEQFENVPAERWVNLYKNPVESCFELVGSVYPSRNKADKQAGAQRIACVRLPDDA